MRKLLTFIFVVVCWPAFAGVTAITDHGATVTLDDCTTQTMNTRTYRLIVNGVAMVPDFNNRDPIVLDTLRPGEEQSVQGVCVDSQPDGLPDVLTNYIVTLFDTLDAPIPAEPAPISRTTTSVTVNVAAIAGISQFAALLDYEFYENPEEGVAYFPAGDVTFTGLTQCTGYLFNFRAVTSAGFEGLPGDELLVNTVCE